MVNPNTIKIVTASIIAEAVTADFRDLSTKNNKIMTKEEKIIKWKNKMRKLDKK